MGDLEEDAVAKHEEVDDLWHDVSDLQDMKAMLATDISTNASDILALTTRVETNEGINPGPLAPAANGPSLEH